MELDDARRWADAWLQAWNAHDLDAVLAHVAPDVEFSSPLVPVLAGEASGVLHGREALRAYWAEGLRRLPHLHFTLVDVHAGADSVVVRYRNERGRDCTEVATLRDGEVVRGVAAYGEAP